MPDEIDSPQAARRAIQAWDIFAEHPHWDVDQTEDGQWYVATPGNVHTQPLTLAQGHDSPVDALIAAVAEARRLRPDIRP